MATDKQVAANKTCEVYAKFVEAAPDHKRVEEVKKKLAEKRQ